MKRFGHILLLAAALVMSAAVSCKKDDETDTTPYINGSIKFTLPAYGRVGQTITVEPYGASHPEGKEIRYYCNCTAIKYADTLSFSAGSIKKGDASFSFELPDSLATFSVTCGALATGYYGASSSISITVVDPSVGKSLTGTGISSSDESVFDMRNTSIPTEECKYYVAEAGGLTWMRNNLGYYPAGAQETFGRAYQGSEVMSYVLGRYYTYEEALTACPSGWRLPSEDDWIALGKAVTGKDFSRGSTIEGAAGALMVDAYFNESKLWEFWREVKITNSTGLSVIPAGYAIHSGDYVKYMGLLDYAAFWTSSTTEDGKASYRYFNVHNPDIMYGTADRTSFAASVRCVSDIH